MLSTAPVVDGPRQSVIVLQTTNADVIDFAQFMNDSTRTALEKWMHMAYLVGAQRSVVEGLRASPDRTPNELVNAQQLLNAFVFIHRYQEKYGPDIFPNIQVVDIFND